MSRELHREATGRADSSRPGRRKLPLPKQWGGLTKRALAPRVPLFSALAGNIGECVRRGVEHDSQGRLCSQNLFEGRFRQCIKFCRVSISIVREAFICYFPVGLMKNLSLYVTGKQLLF